MNHVVFHRFKKYLESNHQSSNDKYEYTPYMYCGNDKVPEVEEVYEPTVNMYFVDGDEDTDTNRIFNDLKNAYIYIDLTGGFTKGGNPISIDNYSFSIEIKNSYGEVIDTYTSEDIYANRKNNLNVKEKIKNYVKVNDSNYISVNVIVKNVIGGVKEVTTTTQYSEKQTKIQSFFLI